MSKKLEYGLGWAVPDDAPVAWGARAILQRGNYPIDLLQNRQAMWGEPELRKALGLALDSMMPKLQAKVAEMQNKWEIRGDKENLVVLEEGPLHIRVVANTNASHGYLYMAAWPNTETIGKPVDNPRWTGERDLPQPGEIVRFRSDGECTIIGTAQCHGGMGMLAVPLEIKDPSRATLFMFGCDIVKDAAPVKEEACG